MEATAESFAAKMRELAAGYNADFRLTAAAVSGGADSLALAFLLKDFQKQNGGRAAVLTVNHHLRPEADAEAAMVASLMKKWGIEHHVLNWFPEEGNGGIEEKAREARYRLMEDWCVKNGFYYLLTAHHQQDQAETFLMRLQRGSGVDGLSAMAEMTPRGKICVVRPLLEAEPAALRRLLRENGIVWAEDASNGCDDFLRVRIRKFLPELEKKTGISIRRLAETARALRMTREYLEAETDAFVRVRVRRFEGAGFQPFSVGVCPAASRDRPAGSGAVDQGGRRPRLSAGIPGAAAACRTAAKSVVCRLHARRLRNSAVYETLVGYSRSRCEAGVRREESRSAGVVRRPDGGFAA